MKSVTLTLMIATATACSSPQTAPPTATLPDPVGSWMPPAPTPVPHVLPPAPSGCPRAQVEMVEYATGISRLLTDPAAEKVQDLVRRRLVKTLSPYNPGWQAAPPTTPAIAFLQQPTRYTIEYSKHGRVYAFVDNSCNGVYDAGDELLTVVKPYLGRRFFMRVRWRKDGTDKTELVKVYFRTLRPDLQAGGAS